MKTEISRDSHQPQKRYSGVYQQQGRMLTDADWNELVEILKERLTNALKDVVGNKSSSIGGTPRHRALNIIADATDIFRIQPGYIYVDGVSAQLQDDGNILYTDQSDFPQPPALPDPVAGYFIYADIWERTVTHLMDERLRDKGLHGADTCSRRQVLSQIKWSLFGDDPEQSTKNPSRGNAELSVILLEKTTQPDLCDPCVSQVDVASKVGNYLFRVEVHNVKGDANNPEEITLKWSSENGAEQFVALPTKEEMPEGFISDDWVYEFYDETSEKHLGVHLDDNFVPIRGVLVSPYVFQTVANSNETQTFVRRWDGYCTLDLIGNDLVEGLDRNITLGTADDGKTPGTLGYVSIGSSLEVILSALRLELQLSGRNFVAGDYWLAEVREAEHAPNSVLIDQKTPMGIEHHYLRLGSVSGGGLNDNPEAERKYAFPPLTEMTRMFQVGGDGQEGMPGHILPQPVEVGVANGEWLVEGVTVRFNLEQGGDGALSLSEPFTAETLPVDVETGSDGIARCYWQLGDGDIDAGHDKEQRVKAELIDRDGNPLAHPTLYFNANLSTADQVAYDNPICPVDPDGIPSVNSLLEGELIDSWPDFDGDGDSTVKDVLDVLLCILKARHIPFDPTQKPDRWEDINEEVAGVPAKPVTVQDALDNLVDNLESSDIRYTFKNDCPTVQPYGATSLNIYLLEKLRELTGVPDLETVKIKELWDTLLCYLDAAKVPYNPKIKEQRWSDILDQTNWDNEEILKHADWVKQFGDSENDFLHGVAIDADDNIIMSGTYTGTINFGESDLPASNDPVVFLAKLNPQGEQVWAADIGRAKRADYRQAITVDGEGNVILIARYTGPVDLGEGGVFQCDPGKGTLVAKFSGDTGNCDWARFFGDPEPNLGFKVAIDSNDDVIVSGFFSGTINFDEYELTSKGNLDSYIVKLLSADNGLVDFAVSYGGPRQVTSTNMAINAENNIVITGTFREEIDFGESVPVLKSEGGLNIFLAEFNNNGVCLWTKQYGKAKPDYVYGLALDSEDNIYLCGNFEDEINFGSDEDILTGTEESDIFVAKLTNKGEHILSRAFTGPRYDSSYAISVTTNGTIALAGRFEEKVNFGGDDLDLQGFGFREGYFALLNADLTHLYSEITGGGNYARPKLVAGSGGSLVLGDIFSANIDVAGEPLSSSGGPFDLFVARFDLTRGFPFTVQEAIDELVNNLESSDIGYKLPACETTDYGVPAFKELIKADISFESANKTKLKSLWDAVLCKLDAKRIPYDFKIKATQWGDLKDDWSKNFADSDNLTVSAVAVDRYGNFVLTGTFSGSVNFGDKTLVCEYPGKAVFLAKLRPNGDCIWSTLSYSQCVSTTQFSLGGIHVLIDADQNIVLFFVIKPKTGQGNAPELVLIEEYSVGGELVGGTGFQGFDISLADTIIDYDNNIIVSGSFSVALAIDNDNVLTSEGGTDIFLVKFQSYDVAWAKNFGGAESDKGYDVAIDSANNILLTGFFRDTMNFGSAATELTSEGESDIFIAKFEPANGICQWAESYGDIDTEYGRGLVLDEEDNIYLSGYFQNQITFGGVDDTLLSEGDYDLYIVKLSAEGNYQWSQSFTGTEHAIGHSIAISTGGTLALGGCFTGQVNFGGNNLSSTGERDAYLVLFNSAGNHLFSESIGVSGSIQSTRPRLVAGPDNSMVLALSHLGAGQSEVYVARYYPAYEAETVQAAIDLLFTELDGYLRKTGAQTITGPLTIDDGAATPSTEILLDVKGTVKADAFEGISAGKWSDGAGGEIYYDGGHVGIGSTNPGTRLDVVWEPPNNNLNPVAIFSASGTTESVGAIQFKNTQGNYFNIGVTNNNAFSISKYNQNISLSDDFITVTSEGKAGIGTTEPDYKLDVRGGEGAYLGYFKNDNNGTGTTYGLYAEGDARDTTSSPGVGARFYGRGSLNGASAYGSLNHAYAYGESNAYAVYASATGGGTSGREYAFFGYGDGYFSGNVGIGTQPLHTNVTSDRRRLEIESPWGHWIFLKQKRLTEGGGGFLIHNSWKDTDTADRNSLVIGYLDHTGTHHWGHLSINGPTGDVQFGGTGLANRKVEIHGEIWAKNYRVLGTDYAEYFESQNGKAIPPGTAVVMENEKIRRAKKNETPLGIISANPGMAGGVHVEWPRKYLRDEFGKLIMEEYKEEKMIPKMEKVKKERQKMEKKTIEEEVTRTEIVFEKKKYRQKEITETVTREEEEPVFEEVDLYDAEGKEVIGKHQVPVMEIYEEEIDVLDENGGPVMVGSGKFITKQRPKLNPEYDESKEYTPREQRPEWNCVGLLGQLILQKGQTVAPGWIKIKDISDEVELWLIK